RESNSRHGKIMKESGVLRIADIGGLELLLFLLSRCQGFAWFHEYEPNTLTLRSRDFDLHLEPINDPIGHVPVPDGILDAVMWRGRSVTLTKDRPCRR